MVAGCSFQSTAAPGDARLIDAALDAADDAAPPPIDAPGCPSDFVAVTGAPPASRYKVITVGQSFSAAVSTCAAIDSKVHLARLDSRTETDALFDAIDAAVTTGDQHIYRVVGTRHANGGAPDTWHDLDDVTELAFQPWGQNEPTNLAGETCMSLRLEFFGSPPARVTGADVCTTPHEFACECD